MGVKKKKCRSCGEKYTPTQFAQVVCNPRCAIEYTKSQKEKKERKEHKSAKAEFKLNDKVTQRNLAQKYFNRYIRLRDKDEPCISCGTTKDVIYAAGHFISRGASGALTFNEDNVHKQCNTYCNKHLSGNIRAYRERLIDKIGIDKVLWLEGQHETVKRTAQDYVEIKKKYLKLCNELDNN